jgi:arginase
MPAVDYRMTDGLDFDELAAVLRAALASGRAVGINITIFNPNLDPNRSVARKSRRLSPTRTGRQRCLDQ